ncbi:phage tail tape measure protein [Streptomyces griseofuscus]|uniref:phage tail tape measure protein n=1 Tax=Streptomyces griseofuscus TaxID=146922 RepID=UPI00379D61D2
MPVEVGVGYVSIVPEMSRFGPELDRQMSRQEGRLQTSVTRPMTQAGGDAGEGAGSGILGGIGGKLKAGMVGVAVAGAAVFAKGFGDALEQEKAGDKLAAQLGLNDKQSARLGKISGSVYAKGYGESVEQVNDSLKALAQNGVAAVNAPKKDLAGLSKAALNLADTFDADVGESAKAAGQLIRTGLAKDGKAAFDLLTAGFQSGADKAGDLIDTVNEYGTQWRKAGLSGATAIGLLNQGLKAGARDGDLVADSIKEFSIRAIDGSKTTATGFKALGLNADDMAAKFAKGGSAANGVLQLTLDKLRGIKDPVKQSQAAVALFGTQAEDLGASLLALDPSTAAAGLGKVGGAAAKMGDTLHDNAASKIEAFKRGAMQKLVTFIGGYVLPPLEKVGSVVTRVVAPAFGKASDVAGRLFSSFDGSGALSTVTSTLVTAGTEVRNTLAPAFSTLSGTVTGTLVPALSGLWSVVSSRLVPALGGALGASLSITWGLLSKVGAILIGTVWPAAMRVYSALADALGPIISSVSSFIQQRAVPAVQMIGAKLGELVDRAQPVISVVATVASWLGVLAAKVTGYVVPVLINLIGPVFSAVFTVLGTAIGWLTAVVGAVVSFGRGVATVATAVGGAFVWLWQNAVSPALSGIRTAVSVAWSIIGPILEVGAAVVRKTFGLAFSWAYNNAIRPAMSGIGSAVSAAGAGVMSVLRPVGNFVRGTLGPVFTWLYRSAIQPAMSGASSVISSIWHGGIKPVFSALKSTVGTIGDSFRTAKDAVAKSWSGIKDAAKSPVNFVLGTVWNNGLLSAWNAIAGWVGLDKHKLKKVKLLAAGGTLGPEPGVYNSPTAIVGEGNPAHPEFVIPTDPRYRKRALALHAAAGAQLLADGGVIGTVKGWGSDAVDTVVGGAKAVGGAIKSAADFLTDPSKAMSAIFQPILSKLDGLGGGVFGKAVATVPKLAVNGIKSAVSKFLEGSGGGSIGGKIPSGKRRAIIAQALAAAGVPPPGSLAQWLAGLNTLITRESGWNPSAINRTDSNAKAGHPSQGLAQTIPSTFNAYVPAGLRKRGILDPVANVAAAIRYIVSRYGNISAVQQANANAAPKGYASGGRPRAGEIAWVGERGPELIRFGSGGATVWDNHTSMGMAAGLGALRGFAKGTSGAKAARKQVPGDLSSFTKSLKGSAGDISKAAKSLADDLRKTGAAGKSLAATVGSTSAKLQSLAKQRDAVSSRIEAGKQAAADQTKTASDYLGLSNLANVTNVDALIMGMQSRQATLKNFDATIKTAQKKGVSQGVIQQLIALGPESDLARIVSGASAGDIKKINSLNASGAKLSASYGRDMADAMYDSGAMAGKGFLAGLKAQEAALQKEMTKLGGTLVKAIEKRLDIHSPARETERVGRMVGAGVVVGTEKSLASVRAGARRLGAAAIPPAVPTAAVVRAAVATTGGQPGGTTYNVYPRTLDMTVHDLELLQRRQDALARVGRPR